MNARKPKPAFLDLPAGVYVLFAVRLINASGSFVLPFLTMILTRKLLWAEADAGTFLTVANLCGMAWTLVAGKLGDAFGRKRTIAGSQLLAGAALAACAFVGMKPFLPWLLAPVVVLLNGTWPVFNAVVADIAPPGKRKEAFSLLYWGNNVGFALGPLVAGFLFERNALLMFAGNAAALFCVSALILFALRDGPRPLSGNAILTEEPEPPEEAGMSGSVLKALLARPLVVLFAAAMILLNFAYNQHLFSLPIRLDTIFGESGPGIFGKLMSVNAITVVALTLPVTALFRRLPPLANMAIASAFYAVGFGAYAAASRPWHFYALTAVWTIGEILSATSYGVYVSSRAPRSHRARFNAALNCVASAGTVLCPAVSGAVISAWGSGKVWFWVLALSALGSAAMLALAAAEARKPVRA